MVGRRNICRAIATCACALLVLSAGLACGRTPTATSSPSPSLQPLPTADPIEALDGALYVIELNGHLIASEELHAHRESDGILVTSNLHLVVGADEETEQRTLYLSENLDPAHYELERTAWGVRSTWIVQSDGESASCLSLNQDWYGPVLADAITPRPQLFLESSPSALPFVWLALRVTEGATTLRSTEPLTLSSLDPLADYPTSRSLAVTTASDRQGAVIGTVAFEGAYADDPAARFTLWLRPENRELYSVEVSNYRFSLWLQLAYPETRQGGTLVIRRVSTLPTLASAQPTPAARTIPMVFTGADGTQRSGTLTLPVGAGPFPCLVLHSPGGVRPRWDPGTVFAAQGWAVLSYDPRGIGQSEGTFARNALGDLAADAVAAAEALQQRPEIRPQEIFFVGLGDAAQVGALANTLTGAYRGYVLGIACAQAGTQALVVEEMDRLLAPFGAWDGASLQAYRTADVPALDMPSAKYDWQTIVDRRVRQVLAPFYGWDEATVQAYEQMSMARWRQWLDAGLAEVELLGRRVRLQGLAEWAAFDLTKSLSLSPTPILVLVGQDALWTPTPAALEPVAAQRVSGNLTLQGLVLSQEELETRSTSGLPVQVEDAILAWCSQVTTSETQPSP